MVPSPPQRSGDFEDFSGHTWQNGTPAVYLIYDIDPPVSSDSSIRVVINGIPSNTLPLIEDKVNLNVVGSVDTVVTVQRTQNGTQLQFSFGTDFVIETFELYIDSVKVININV